jgi:hypothetical protein
MLSINDYQFQTQRQLISALNYAEVSRLCITADEFKIVAQLFLKLELKLDGF